MNYIALSGVLRHLHKRSLVGEDIRNSQGLVVRGEDGLATGFGIEVDVEVV